MVVGAKVSSIGFIKFYTTYPEILFNDEETDQEISWELVIEPDIKKWLDQNSIVDYTVDAHYFYFENEEDAVAFKLRWL